MYQLKIPDQNMKSLYLLRVEHGRGPIIGQVRQAIKNYLAEEERKIGEPIQKVEIKDNNN